MTWAAKVRTKCRNRAKIPFGRPIPGSCTFVNSIMASKIEVPIMHPAFRIILFTVFALVPLFCRASPANAAPPAGVSGQPESDAQGFPTPEAAVKALLDAARAGDPKQFADLFGSRYAELLSSGDEVQDKNDRDAFAAKAQEKTAIENVDDHRAILRVGASDWPFPIPLVKQGESWRFAAGQGREEIINRRVGRNELSTLGVINAYVEAQFEYAAADRDGDGVAEYAQRLGSTPGAFDGLYWDSEPDRPQSPLGPLVAEARAAGYQAQGTADKSAPYHGYYYRILTRQGSAAPGGKYDYVINGNMIAGFGLVAFPAQYGSSGVMTFIVNHQGKIHQKDLGPQTAKLASALKEYNPGAGWELVTNSGK
ncbi:MAG: DUF2950 domain-containing protein [Pseudomonadota bacterium]